jgi:hypothetical protein
MWRYVTPGLCILLSFLAVINEIRQPVSIVSKSYQVPAAARAFGWMIALCGLVPILWWAYRHWGDTPAPIPTRSADDTDGPVVPTNENIDFDGTLHAFDKKMETLEVKSPMSTEQYI